MILFCPESMVVLIPAYKPQQSLLELCETLKEMGFSLVVVNDGSGSDFDSIFSQLPPGTVFLDHEVNRGKGQALKTGLKAIEEYYPQATVIVTADADGQHLPEDILQVGKALTQGEQGLIIGSRRFHGKVPFKSRFGNTLTRWLFALSTRVRVYDTQSGLRAFSPADIPFLLSVPGERYEYELNVLMHATRKGIPIREVPIHTVYEKGNPTSHFHVIRDSYRVYAQLLKFSLSSLGAFWLDYIALLILRNWLIGMGLSRSLLISSIIARLISATFNYTVNRLWVFNSQASVKKTASAYVFLAIMLWIANYGVLYLIHMVASVPLWLAKPMADIILFVASYNIQKRYIFSDFQR